MLLFSGELIGVEYLFAQTGQMLPDSGRNPDAVPGPAAVQVEEVDEGWTAEADEGFEDEDPQLTLALEYPELQYELLRPNTEQEEVKRAESWSHLFLIITFYIQLDFMTLLFDLSQDVIGPDGQGGWHHVVRLATVLATLRGARFVLPSVALRIVNLWRKLSEADRAPVSFPPRYPTGTNQGRMFRTSKTGRQSSVPGVESRRR